uniref:FMN-binding domain-containing protein n=1 Tax=uncultured bacterium fosmid pJB71G8 TaxID=1478068 RepID=A0A0H3U7Q1_9BACT|nr:hypothetical protein [uncultured bacterium fosmid pJB71G8]
MTMNKNSNTYQIVYSAIMVILVGVVLAVVYMWLKPMQDENIANDKRKQILSALHINGGDNVKETYEKYIVLDMLVDADGNVADTTANVAFDVNMANNAKADAKDRKLPVFKCKVDDGTTKYVIPVYGAGLWGSHLGFCGSERRRQHSVWCQLLTPGRDSGSGSTHRRATFPGCIQGQEAFQGRRIQEC